MILCHVQLSQKLKYHYSVESSQMLVRTHYVSDVNQTTRSNRHWGNPLALDFFSHSKASDANIGIIAYVVCL